jgi:hypothetical protein
VSQVTRLGTPLKFCRHLIDEPLIADDTSSDSFLQARATLIEPILRLTLPSIRYKTLRATASIIRNSIHIWVHETFIYQDDFAFFFQSLFGATFSEVDLFLHPLVIYRHDLCRVWLETQRIHELGPCFRLRWEAETALSAGELFGEISPSEGTDLRLIEPVADLSAVFIDTMHSLASLIRFCVYLAAQEDVQFPALAVGKLNFLLLTGILREVGARP